MSISRSCATESCGGFCFFFLPYVYIWKPWILFKRTKNRGKERLKSEIKLCMELLLYIPVITTQFGSFFFLFALKKFQILEKNVCISFDYTLWEDLGLVLCVLFCSGGHPDVQCSVARDFWGRPESPYCERRWEASDQKFGTVRSLW